MLLVRGPGPLARVRRVWSKPDALKGKALSPKEPTGDVGHGGCRALPSFGWCWRVEGNEAGGEWVDCALLEKKVTLTHCNVWRGHLWKLNQLIELKLSKAVQFVYMSPSGLQLPWLLWWQFWAWASRTHLGPPLAGAGLDAGCRHCWQCGHLLELGMWPRSCDGAK